MKSSRLARMAFALLVCWASSSWGAWRGTVSGVTKDQSGQPVAGAYVKLTNDDRRLVFMVISQEQGKFQAANLPPGKYTVQGIAGGFETDPLVVVDVNESAVSVNLSLTAPQPKYPDNTEYTKWLT